MAPTKNSEDARAEQLRLAKELQRDFQKSGTFMANPSGPGRSSSRASRPNQPPRRPPPHAPRQQAHNPSAGLPRNPNGGKSFSGSDQAPNNDSRKRKMNTQPADFFADRPNTGQERGRPVQYYQGQDRTTTSATPVSATGPEPSRGSLAPGFSLIDSPTPEQQSMQTTQPLRPQRSNVMQNMGMDQSRSAPASTYGALPIPDEIPRGPIVWHYQDNDEQPQPLARDENMMDMDMPDASTTGVLSERPQNQMRTCTCAHNPASGANARGLGASRWAVSDMAVDNNCPEHGAKATSFSGNNTNNSRATQAAPENLPNPRVWYYQ